MVTIGSAFMNKVYAFNTLYRYIRNPSEYKTNLALILLQHEIFWSTLVFSTIIGGNRVNKEVFNRFYPNKKPIIDN